MHKKIMAGITLLVILSLILSVVTVYAADEDLYSNLEETAQQSKDEYFVQYRDNYIVDTEEMSFSVKNMCSSTMDMIVNSIFSLQILLGKITISVFSFALSTNISLLLGEFLEPFMAAMKSSLWDNFAVYTIAFAAFVLIIKMAQNRTSQALSSLMGIILIITMTFIFYAYPMQMLKAIDTVTSGISDEIMEGPYQVTVGGAEGEAKGKATALCWNLFVHKPWQVLEFGSINTAKKYEADILKLTPYSEEREGLVKTLAESEGLFSKSIGYQGERLTTSFIFLLFNIILMGVLIAFSVLIIVYQFLLLVYLMLGIFVFLVALIPQFGMPLVERWAYRVIGVSFTKVMVVFFLSITLVFMQVVYGFAEEYGILVTMFLMLVLIGALWFERYRFLDLFTGFKSNVNQLPQSVKKGLDKDVSAVQGIQHVRQTTLRHMEDLKAKRTNPENENSDKNSKQSERSSAQPVRLSVRNNEGSGRSTENVEYMQQTGEKVQSSAENLKTASQDISMYFRRAESLLQKQYEYSKAKSEVDSAEKNKPVEYDSFVKKTNKIRAQGGRDFDQRHISRVANMMRSAVEQGGKVDDVYSDGKTIHIDKQQNKRPKSLSSVHRDSINNEPISKITKSEKVSGIKYFESNFGEYQGEEIYERLEERYGKDKLKNYRPFYNNNGKQTYAQVIKQLNENIDVNQRKSGTEKAQTSSKLRTGGGRSEKT